MIKVNGLKNIIGAGLIASTLAVSEKAAAETGGDIEACLGVSHQVNYVSANRIIDESKLHALAKKQYPKLKNPQRAYDILWKTLETKLLFGIQKAKNNEDLNTYLQNYNSKVGVDIFQLTKCTNPNQANENNEKIQSLLQQIREN